MSHSTNANLLIKDVLLGGRNIHGAQSEKNFELQTRNFDFLYIQD